MLSLCLLHCICICDCIVSVLGTRNSATEAEKFTSETASYDGKSVDEVVVGASSTSKVPRSPSKLSALEMVLNPLMVLRQPAVQPQRSMTMLEMADLTSAAVGAKIVASDSSPAGPHPTFTEAVGNAVAGHSRSSSGAFTQQQTSYVEADREPNCDNVA